MLEGFIGWLSESGDKVSLLVVPIQKTKSSFDWSAVIPTIIGGLISAVIALAMFRLSNSSDRKKRREEDQKRAASEAIAGFIKIQQNFDIIANINLQIDKCIMQSYEDGLFVNDVALMISPSAGYYPAPEPIKANEISFLLNTSDYSLSEDILLMDKRVTNIKALYDKYNDMFLDYQSWIEAVPGVVHRLDGSIATSKIPEEAAFQYEKRVAQLNRIIVGIVEQLEEECAFAYSCLTRYVEAAHRVHKGFFPKLEFEIFRSYSALRPVFRRSIANVLEPNSSLSKSSDRPFPQSATRGG